MAEKSFGVKEINLIGASGTPTIESPNNLNLSAVNVAISTNATIGGTLSVTGNVSVGGTLTYEDVTNIDSVGIITAREGVVIPDSKALALGNRISGSTLGDLRLYHDGSNSYIDEVGDGGLFIRNGTKTSIYIQTGGKVELYHNNNPKLETSSTGATVTGTLAATAVTGDGSGLTNLPSPDPSNADIQGMWTVSNNGSSYYNFTGPGVTGSENNPTLYLVRGQRYRFVNSTGSNHPFAFRESSGGSAYTDGISGSQNGTQDFNVQFDAPSSLVYQCTIHSGMVGIINIVGNSLNGGGNNRVLTSTGGQGIVGESNLTFNGSTLDVTGDITASTQINVGSNVKLGNAGVVTATTFSGSGASLTSIPAGQLTGTVADANITTLTASKLSGALPAISGANLTNLPSPDPTNADIQGMWTVGGGLSGYTFTGPGVESSQTNPTLYLVRGQRYRFVNSTGSSHPFAFRVSSGGSAYTDGITGSQSGTQDFSVQFDAPATLVYQCTNHSSMVGIIYITGNSFVSGANNRVLTATGSNGIVGESDLTFDGNKLTLAANSTAYDAFQIGDGLFIGNTTNNINAAIFHQGGGADLEIGSQNEITFTTGNTAGNATERVRITSGTNPNAYLHVKGNGGGSGNNLFFKIESTSSSSYGPNLIMQHSSSSPADNDVISEINFNGLDSASNRTTFAKIDVQATDVSNGTEDGILIFKTRRNGTIAERLRIGGGSGSGGGIVNVKDYGAVGDYNVQTSSGTDDRAAIILAIEALGSEGGTVYFPPGNYYVSTTIEINGNSGGSVVSNCLIFEGLSSPADGGYGDAGGAEICAPQNSNYTIFYVNGAEAVYFRNLRFRGGNKFGSSGNGSNSTNHAIKLERQSYGGNDHLLENLIFVGMTACVIIYGCGRTTLRKIKIGSCPSASTDIIKVDENQYGSSGDRRLDQLRIEGCVIDGAPDNTSDSSRNNANGLGIYATSNTIFVKDTSIIRSNYNFYLDSSSDGEFIYFQNCEAERAQVDGFYINGSEFISIDNCFSCGNNQSGIRIDSNTVSSVSITNPNIRTNQRHGIHLDSGNLQDLSIVNARMGANNLSNGSYHNIYLENGTHNVYIAGGKLGGAVDLSGSSLQRYGIYIDGTSHDNIRIIGTNVNGNLTGGIYVSNSWSGSGNKIQFNSGTSVTRNN